MKEKARQLRKNQTDAEKTLWKYLRDRRMFNSKFRRQHVVGPYIVDFVCLGQKLVIELDGGQHAEQIEYDAQRTAFLVREGFRVMRFWNNQVLAETESVLDEIRAALMK